MTTGQTRPITLPDELPPPLADDYQKRWQSFQKAAAAAGISPAANSQVLQSSKYVFAFSDFAAASCTRDPAMLTDLVDTGDLFKPRQPDDYRQIIEMCLADVEDEDALMRRLRHCRRREMVRVAWRDLAGRAYLAETMTDLSAFADACLHQTLQILYQWQCDRYGLPTAADGSKQHPVILGLGKLGARELNFSSDVDLIFVYPKSGKTHGTKDTTSNEDFFTRLCRRLIKVIGQPTADGFVYRVDARLRPFGESGPLAMDFDTMEQYYQQQGREWERYALIKARAVAGDIAAGNFLLERLHPFIYRRYLDYSAFESLREMKQMIVREVNRRGMANNIKLGPGGIREIEFFGQIFQLIRGGVTPALQDTGIIRVLKALAADGHIPRKVCRELVAAYIFLRNTENRLQAYSDQQTHQLPSDGNGKLRLAASMGYSDTETYIALLNEHRQIVHGHFQMLLETGEADNRRKDDEDPLEVVWQEIAGDKPAEKTLEAMGYDQPDEVLQLLDYLRNAPETKALSPRGRQRLDKLVPRFLKEARAYDNPLTTLRRVIDLIKTIERRTSYLALLLENPTALTHLVKLSHASPWIASFLAQHPVLLDELLDPRTLYLPPHKEEMQAGLRQRMGQIPLDDLEYQIEQLCIFKQINVLRVASADVTGTLPLMRVSDYLSDIAECILGEVVDLAWNHLVAKHGAPVCRLDDRNCGQGFAVIAYGKLGGLELGYGSDLDLVFLHAGTHEPTRGGEKAIDSAQFFNRLGQRVIHILTSHTRAGKAYEIDMRLRPSGTSGILVSHIDSFGRYQMEEAWTWEHQALIKARPVCGDDSLTSRFDTIRRNVLARPRSKEKLTAEVANMRERMRKELLKPEGGVLDLKQGAGAMVDIEFLVQYLVLLHSYQYAGLLQWTDNVRLIQALIETGAMDEYTAHVLKHAYLIYRAAAHQLSLQEKPAKVPRQDFAHLQKRVAEIWEAFIRA
ncbi:MAG: bifunctional [glutamate--ammonia ligase]-adenylyl-L-tyrosine phosphorylase/[glutamate--ammonia-ligase] adenylyltransferase [Deltaproteobacteria bacterium]|jgi:glutamate-ammonia-ligase adenylyltransferase|nr:bifunctional [glutamate--ammonia ligase]-adenylyl-L-tyrosine phosphorylase/[glutamate--ammonia-ligase] adenylyltransferase [Deltaproteobacteria bacterium]